MTEGEICKLAEKFNLKVTVLPSVVLVYSKVNAWVIEQYDTKGFKLFHFDNPMRSFKRHEQMIFRDIAANYNTIFEYIKTHDFSIFQEKHLLGNISRKLEENKMIKAYI